MNSKTPKRIGLLAGAGEVPVYFASRAAQNGIKIVSVAFTDEIDASLAPHTEKHYSIGIGRTGKIFRTFHEEDIQDLVMLGKVDKGVVFKPQMFDLRALKFFKELRTQEDKTLLLGVIRELEKEGFRVLDQREFLREIFPEAGVLTRCQPSKKHKSDIDFGLPIAKRLADMEIGQTIVVKQGTVVAVEAVEGTDRAIERGCELSRGQSVVIKVSRTDQDFRYDCPGIGPTTLQRLIDGGAAVLAVEAGRVMIVDQQKVVEMADRAGLSIICV